MTKEAIDTIKRAAFMLECVAHLQKLEYLLLPHAEALRKIVEEATKRREEGK